MAGAMIQSHQGIGCGGGTPGFISHVQLVIERVPLEAGFPFLLPAIRALHEKLVLDSRATILVGENGSGKSTLIEAIAVAAGFNAEGGTMNFRFASRPSESQLHRAIRIARTERRPRTGFFLRAESFFNVATHIEALDRQPALAPPIIDSYGGKSLHELSHGESFLALVRHRFGSDGLYILDEPEAALSPSRQLTLLSWLHEL
jgi:predicted ATPase